MFENLTPPNNYITYALRCQWKFDFVKNLTIARANPGPGAVDDNIIIATCNPKKERSPRPLSSA